MNCAMALRMLDAYLDGELDASTTADVSAHLAACARCASAHERRVALRGAFRAASLRESAPQGLRESVLQAIHDQGERRTRRPVVQAGRSWLLAAFAAAAAFVGGWWVGQPPLLRDLPSIVVASHIASLAPSGPRIDVASSDRHMVKPWFQGRAQFAPTVRDMGAQGFALVGARLDRIGGREAIAVVYRLRGHFISVYSWPHRDGDPHPDLDTTWRGFNLVQWSDRDIDYAAVSDVDAVELRKLVAGIRGD